MKKEDSVVYLNSAPQHSVNPPLGALLPMAGTGLETLPEVHMVENTHRDRLLLEGYIHDRFAKEYGADINKFMPFLIKFSSNLQTYAALGFRTAANNRLFLETYLTKPIQDELAEITGLEVVRDKIIEVGNLAATKPGSSAPLFGATACFLDRIGYEWVVICATQTVQNIFSKLQIPLIGLAEASEAALPDDQKLLWGSYYHAKPQVMAVHVKTAHRCVKESAIGKRLLNAIYPSIDVMVEEWRVCHG
jgi:hypothetical protein